jgi:hypothetical protein
MKAPWLLLLAFLGTHPAAVQQPAPYTYQGTVQAVRPRTRELDLLTGVGQVMRVIHMRVVPATTLVAGDRTMTLAEVIPGDIVRVDCRLADSGLVADRIERIGHLGPGGAPEPRRP